MKLKWILYALIGIVVLVIGGAVIALSTFDPEDYRETIQAEVEKATGRQLTLAGPIDLSISLTPAIQVEDVSFANADWGSEPQMASMKRFEFELELLPLISGNIQVKRLVLVEPTIYLETNAEGAGNWTFGGDEAMEEAAEAAPDASGGPTIPTVNEVRIENGQVTYKDGQTGEVLSVKLDEFTGTADSIDSPLAVVARGSFQDSPFSIDAEVGALSRLMQEEGEPFPVRLAAEAAGVTIGAEGTIADPIAADGVAISFTVEGDGVEELARLAGQDAPPVGPFKATGIVTKEGENLKITDLDASAEMGGAQVTAKGTVDDLQGAVNAQMSLTAEGTSTSTLSSLAGQELPAVGPYKVAFDVVKQGERIDVTNLSVDAEGGGATVTVNGQVEDAIGTMVAQAAFALQAADISTLGSLAGTSLPAIGPLDVTGTATRNGDAVSITGLSVKMGESDLTGDLEANLGGDRPSVKGNLTSTTLRVADLMPGGDGEAAAESGGGGSSQYVFTPDPLPLDGLKAADAEILLSVGTLTLPDGTVMRNVDLTLSLQAGHLKVTPLSTNFAGGQLTVNLDLNAGAATPTLALAVNGDRIDYGQILKERGITDQLTGTLNVDVDINGAGNSMRAIASSMNGSFAVIGNEGQISNRLLRLLSGALAEIYGPLLGEDKQTRINCMVIDFGIANGLASSRGLAIDTDAFTVAGGGTINLKTEGLDLFVDTSTKQASIASLAVPVNIGGTLASPSFSPDPLASAQALAGAVGAVGGKVLDVGAVSTLLGGGGGEQASGGSGNACVQAAAAPGSDALNPLESVGSAVEGIIGGGEGGVQGAIEGIIGGGQEGEGGGIGSAIEGLMGGGQQETAPAPESTEAAPQQQEPASPVEELQEGIGSGIKSLFGD